MWVRLRLGLLKLLLGREERLCQRNLGVQTLAESLFDVLFLSSSRQSSPFFLFTHRALLLLARKHVLYAQTCQTKSCWLKELPVTRRLQTTPAPANHLSAGSVSRKAQSESCWQEAAALHLCGEVSVKKMCLSSAPSSLLTSVLIMTSPRHCSLLVFHFQFSALIRIILLLKHCHHGLDHMSHFVSCDWISSQHVSNSQIALCLKTSELNCFAFAGVFNFFFVISKWKRVIKNGPLLLPLSQHQNDNQEIQNTRQYLLHESSPEDSVL